MLVLSRKLNEAIIIDGNIRVVVVGIQGNQVRLGIEAPSSVPIFRQELCDRADAREEPPAGAVNGHAAGCSTEPRLRVRPRIDR
jgi:carbon storage regulator